VVLVNDFITSLKHRSIAERLPEVCQIDYDLTKYEGELYQEFDIAEPIDFSRNSKRRNAQFLAGRLAATSVLEDAGSNSFVITTGNHREPLWPPGYIGSISHQEQSSVAIARQRDICASAKIFPGSLGLGIDYQVEMTLVFSAKESFFKAAFNSVGYYFDFDAVSIKSLDAAKQMLALETELTLSAKLTKGFRADVTYQLSSQDKFKVLTVCG